MLSRPSDNGHTPFGDIFYSESPDMCFWGKHRHVMSPAAFEDSVGSVRRSVRALSYRDFRGLVIDLPRRASFLQRVCV